MTEKASYRKGFLAAEFIAHNYRLSGEFSTRTGALGDQLNDKMNEYARLENIYVSPITDPASLKGHYAAGQIQKSNLTMVVVTREEDAYPRRTTQMPAPGPAPFRAFITVPGFEMSGGVKLENLVEIDRLLIQSVERFITLYNATATVTTDPKIIFTGGGILINRQHIGIFCIEKNTVE